MSSLCRAEPVRLRASDALGVDEYSLDDEYLDTALELGAGWSPLLVPPYRLVTGALLIDDALE